MPIQDTFTSNSMQSFAFQGKTYTRRVDNGAVVYDISAGTDGSAFSTGWVQTDGTTAVANGATLTFNHNLGTTDLVVDIYVSSSADGSNPQDFQRGHASGTSNSYGGGVTNITENILEIQLGTQGYLDLNSSGQVTTTSFSGKYIKVVASARMGAGAGGTPAGSNGQLQLNDNGAFGSNPNLWLDSNGNLSAPRLAIGVGSYGGDEGGEIALRQSETNNDLAGNWVYMDVWQNQIRFFEDGTPYKGAYLDLTECADGVATNLLAGGSGGGEWFVLDQTSTFNHLAGSSSNISSVTDLGTGKSRINFVNSYSNSTSYGIGVVSDEASSSSVYVYLGNTTASSFELWNRVADSFRDAENLRGVISPGFGSSSSSSIAANAYEFTTQYNTSSRTDKWGHTTYSYSITVLEINKIDQSLPDITAADIRVALNAASVSGSSNSFRLYEATPSYGAANWTSFNTIDINGVTYDMYCPRSTGLGYIRPQ